jgi:hypothetical protein
MRAVLPLIMWCSARGGRAVAGGSGPGDAGRGPARRWRGGVLKPPVFGAPVGSIAICALRFCGGTALDRP